MADGKCRVDQSDRTTEPGLRAADDAPRGAGSPALAGVVPASVRVGGVRGAVVRSGLIACAGVLAACAGSAVTVGLGLHGFAGVLPVIGGLGLLAGSWIVAWRMGSEPLRTLVGIGEALEGYRGGELAQDAMRVAANSPFAQGWNALVGERGDAREAWLASSVDRRAATPASAAGGSGLIGALDALWQGLLLVDEDSRVLHANGAATVLLGVPRDHATGRTLGEFALPEDVVETVRSVVNGKRARETTELVRGEGPERSVLRVSARRVRREDRGEAIVLFEDITQQRVADEARHALVAQATHELRTPLTTIRLLAEEAIDLGEDAGDGAREVRASALNVINTEARRLERVVNDLLSVSELEAGGFVLRVDDIRLDAVFDDLESDYRAQAEAKGVSLVFEMPPKWPVARADREKLAVALHNLVGNAIKYTPEAGTVTVRIEADDRLLTVAVEDTGIGIRAEEQERVFEKFFRSGDGRVGSITGSGIGLATAREIARLHGGDIRVESELDRGSTFTLTVPIEAGVVHGQSPAPDTGERRAA